MIACIVLLGWIIVLTLTLQRHYTATHWRFAWVGFDVMLLAAFAMTGWAFWRGRQIVIACLLVTATLLCCDAWFDVILDLGTIGVWESLASAAIIELPLAFVMFRAAQRLIGCPPWWRWARAATSSRFRRSGGFRYWAAKGERDRPFGHEGRRTTARSAGGGGGGGGGRGREGEGVVRAVAGV